MKSFKHSGDLGDIIYSLPTIKELGGGILYLNPCNSFTKFNTDGYNFIRPLLLSQDYIHDVKLYSTDVFIDYDLDIFRKQIEKLAMFNLAELCATAQGLDKDIINKQWLNVEPKVIDNKRVVIHRSKRYHNTINTFNWNKHLEENKDNIIFVGLKDEYDAFIKDFGYVEYYKPKNAYDMARVISGAKLFIGNQSMPFSISEGLHKTNLLEVCHYCPNCNFNREGHNIGELIMKFNIDDLKVKIYTENGFIISGVENSPCYRMLKYNEEKEYEDYHNLVKLKYNTSDKHNIKDFKKLLKNIKENGYKENPLLEVRFENGYYTITDGQHRLSILKYLGIEQIKVNII